MTFNEDFLRELQAILNGSKLYRMTNSSVEILLKSKRLHEDDKNIIFCSLINDISTNKDPLSLAVFWNKNINDPKLEFIF
jgi:hypothetical protein